MVRIIGAAEREVALSTIDRFVEAFGCSGQILEQIRQLSGELNRVPGGMRIAPLAIDCAVSAAAWVASLMSFGLGILRLDMGATLPHRGGTVC